MVPGLGNTTISGPNVAIRHHINTLRVRPSACAPRCATVLALSDVTYALSLLLRKGLPMNSRVALIALVSALVLGLLGSVIVPSSSTMAACKDPPGGTDCK